MAKRFRDTQVWGKVWIHQLPMEMKLFWFYILDNCDHAGIWDVNIGLASYQIGVELDQENILKVFADKINPFKDDKWFIPKFIEYQYGELNPNNRTHLSVINILNKHKLYGANKGLVSTLQGSKDKDKDKIKLKDKKQDQLEAIRSKFDELKIKFPNRNIPVEFEHWQDYIEARGKKYSNYLSAFRNWLRNENFRKKTKEDYSGLFKN